MHVKFTTARFTTARVRITHLPNSSYPTSFENYAGDMSSAIVDVRGPTEFSFALPYYHEYDYADTAGYCAPALFGDATWSFNTSILPHVAFTLVNPVASPTATDDTTVYYSIWFSAGPDFAFGNFTGHVHKETQKKPVTVVPDIEDLPTKPSRKAPKWVPMPLKFEKHSLAGTFASAFPGLGHAVGSHETGFVIPEKYSALVDLVHRYERTTPYNLGGKYLYQSIASYTEDGYIGGWGGQTTLRRLISLFAYWRGSLRYLLDPNDSAGKMVQLYSGEEQYAQMIYSSPSRTIAYGTPTLQFEIPYDSNSFCIPRVVAFNEDFNTEQVPCFTLMDSLGTTLTNPVLYTAVGEDFQFGLLRPTYPETGDLS